MFGDEDGSHSCIAVILHENIGQVDQGKNGVGLRSRVEDDRIERIDSLLVMLIPDVAMNRNPFGGFSEEAVARIYRQVIAVSF